MVNEQELINTVVADFTQTLEQTDKAVTRLRQLIDLRLAIRNGGIERHFDVNRVLNELKTVDRRIRKYRAA